MGENSLRETIAQPKTQALIRSKARALIRAWGGTREDVEDLVQFISLHLVRLAPRYAAGRAGVWTFISRGIDWGIRSYLKEQRCLKRGRGRRLRSLDAPVPPDAGNGGEGIEGRYVPEAAHRGLVAKFHRILAGAEPLDDRVAQAVMRTGSEAGAARELGISRRQVQNAMERLRVLLERNDFEGI